MRIIAVHYAFVDGQPVLNIWANGISSATIATRIAAYPIPPSWKAREGSWTITNPDVFAYATHFVLSEDSRREFLTIPSHPIHAIFHLMHAGLSPALGHSGYDKLVTKEEHGFKADTYFHYLHHRFFTVNFGTEVVPFDKWFGSFHDDSPEAQAAMMAKRTKTRKNKP